MFDVVEIGWVQKARGIKGQVAITVQEEYEDLITKNSFIFVKQDGLAVPYKVIDVQFTNRHLIKVSKISNPEDAVEISSRPLFIEKSRIPTQSQDQDILDMIGYLVYDKKQLVGSITGLVEYPQQVMMEIVSKDKKRNIPLVLDWLQEDIDHISKKIIMDLPAGMLDL